MSIDSDWEDYKAVEAQLQDQLMADLNKTLDEQARFSKFVDDWVSAIGKENILFIDYKGKKLWDFSAKQQKK